VDRLDVIYFKSLRAFLKGHRNDSIIKSPEIELWLSNKTVELLARLMLTYGSDLMKKAEEIAVESGSNRVFPEHLLKALLNQENEKKNGED
jgi:hypothetical protein